MKIIFTILFFLASINIPAQTEYRIAPRTTDNSIDKWPEDHYVYVNNSIPESGRLLLFFAGSGHTPDYDLLILKQAANKGYKAIGLRYPNSFSLSDLCSKSTDSSCYEKVRMEMWDGTDRTGLISVSKANSVENRLTKLLIYLKANYPEANWSRYINLDNTINWQYIVVAGHSLGGGMAAMIAHLNRVARVAMFSAPTDYSDYFNKPAFWLSKQHQTPPDHFYGFAHVKDGIQRYKEIWTVLGMDAFGPLINIDSISVFYPTTHMLSTLETPDQPSDYHGSVVVDASTPKLPDGTPVFRRIWEYMGFPVVIIDHVKRSPEIPEGYSLEQNYPNPFNSTTAFTFSIPVTIRIRLAVIDVLGNEIALLIDGEKSQGIYTVHFDAERFNLTAGVYFYRMSAGKFVNIRKMIYLK